MGHDDQGSRARLSAAYDAHAPALFRLAVMILADAPLAEDAVHQAFANLAAAPDRLADVRSQGPYLRQSVRHECYRLAANRRRASEPLDRHAPLLESAGSTAARDEERRTIETALRELSPEQREVVHLKVYEGKTFAEIARLQGVSLNTAASRYRYATDRLRGLLGKLAGDPP